MVIVENNVGKQVALGQTMEETREGSDNSYPRAHLARPT